MSSTGKVNSSADLPAPTASCLLQSSALPFILQHPSVHQQQDIICRLLCTSKAMQYAIQHSCAGQLPVTLDTAASTATATGSPLADAFCTWLTHYARTVGTLNFYVKDMEASKRQSLAVAVAVALQQAGPTSAQDSRCSAGQLTNYRCLLLRSYYSNLVSPGILQQLPSRSLTQLAILPACGADVIDWTQGHYPAPRVHTAAGSSASATAQDSSVSAQQALAQLTNLQSLKLFGHHADELLPAVTALHGLTALQLHKLSSSSVNELQHIPGHKLQRLTFTVSPNIHGWQRKQLQPQLGHLTALRELDCTGEGLFAVQAHDMLPQQLTGLTVVDCPSAQPLLPLKELKALQVTACTMRAAELQQLSSHLKQLQQVRLAYDRDPEVIRAAAAGWASLPLCDLILRVYPGPVAADTVQELSKLRGLSHLSIEGYEVRCEVTAAQLAGVLRQLTGLRELKLASLRLLPDEQGLQERVVAGQGLAVPAGGSGVEAGGGLLGVGGMPVGVLQAYGAAGVLSALGLVPVAVGGAADGGSLGMRILMRVIAGLHNLCSFSFNQFSLGMAAVELSAATGLTSLKLDECELVDSAVVFLAQHLTGLKRLSLSWNFKLSDAIVEPIASGLIGLQELFLCSTKVSNTGALASKVPTLKVVV